MTSWAINPSSRHYFAGNAGGVSIDLVAKNLSALSGSLATTPLGSCAQGNDERASVDLDLEDVDYGTDYEGPAVYQGSDAHDQPTLYTFALPALPPQYGLAPLLAFDFSEGYSAPAIGTVLWLSHPRGDMATLREKEHGRLLFGSAFLQPPLAAGTAATLQQLFGVAVTATKRCDYAKALDSSVGLWDLDFATDPPVHATSGSRTTLELDGNAYDVWVWGEDQLGLSIFQHTP